MSGRRRALLPVLHFHRQGGIEVYTWELACALRRLGWTVEIVSCLQSGQGLLEGFPHTGLAPAEPGRMRRHTERWPIVLETYLRRREPTEDLVIAAHPFTLPQVGPYARAHGLPWAVVFYGVEAWELYGSLQQELLLGGTVLAISHYTAEAIERQVSPAYGPVQLLPPAVDTSRFYPGKSVGVSPRTLLTVSRLSMRDWFKGHEIVIEALPGIIEQLGEPVRYRIAGKGPYRVHLEGRAADLGVARQVEFLGFVDAGQLPDLYREADVFVMPSRLGRQDDGMLAGEGFGIVYVEAGACGTPSVGLAHGGTEDAIADGVSGLLVPDREQVADALLQLLQDPEERDRLGRDAARWTREHFSREAFDARLARILERAMAASQPEASSREDDLRNPPSNPQAPER